MRQKRRQRRRRLAKKSASPVVSLDPFRRARFESEFRRAMERFKNQRVNEDTFKRMRKRIVKLFRRYAKSRKLAESIKVSVRQSPLDPHTVEISYERDGVEIHANRLYDALNPGARPVIGWRMKRDGSRLPICSIDELPEAFVDDQRDGDG